MLPDVKINNFNCCAVAAFISYNYNLQNVRREKCLKKKTHTNTNLNVLLMLALKRGYLFKYHGGLEGVIMGLFYPTTSTSIV